MFYDDILDQPKALRSLTDYYTAKWEPIPINEAGMPLLSGMGASFHAASIAALHLQSLRVQAAAIEATDLLNYGSGLLRNDSQLVFVSQSGMSGEVAPILEQLPKTAHLIAVTNNVQSSLGQGARVTLDIQAGYETSVATKTYVKSLAVLWLLARQWGNVWTGREFKTLTALVDQIEKGLATAQPDQWVELFGKVSKLYFLGHGPHAYTARQSAMMVSEWAKIPVHSASIGAFRHGLIESAQPDMGAIIFAPPGRTAASAQALAQELDGYGVKVLIVANDASVDEFLAPILNVIPAQLFAEALARHLGVEPAFRHISKVVKNI